MSEDATELTRELIRIISRMDPHGRDPSIVIQRRKVGVRIMVYAHCMENRLAGFIMVATEPTIEQALQACLQKIQVKAQNLINGIQLALEGE